ncbi:MAG: metalloregulator ArsR/SmtB family transcription factor [Gammaproteobacteria bacterium]|nr:metalloregulator ArsR/SmtB family transcription factor [Gammaproteobacteria bacterium]
MNIEEMTRNARKASQLLKSLSNERRLLLLCYLVKGERSVGELQALLPELSQSALSQHLSRLRRDGLVATRRSAQTVHYRLAAEEPRAVIEQLYQLYCGSTD